MFKLGGVVLAVAVVISAVDLIHGKTAVEFAQYLQTGESVHLLYHGLLLVLSLVMIKKG